MDELEITSKAQIFFVGMELFLLVGICLQHLHGDDSKYSSITGSKVGNSSMLVKLSWCALKSCT